ncbi:MAG: hypothetical protein ACRDY7_01295 [Acidimicrobiia bacterium]
MRIPRRWKVAASAVPFVAATLAGMPARSAETHRTPDPGGDVVADTGGPHDEPRADIVEATAEHRADRIVLRLRTAEPTDPAQDPNWASGFTAMGWALDLDGDAKEEYQVEYGFDPEKRSIYGEVYPAGAGGEAAPACAADAQFSEGTYQLGVPRDCITSPAQISYAAVMLYARHPEDPAAPQAIDRVPDAGFAGPVGPAGASAPPGPAPDPGPEPSPDPAEPRDYGDANPADPTQGYWLVGQDGGVFSFGTARFQGSVGHVRYNSPVVGMAPNPAADGYWFVGADGGIFSFGDAPFFGSTGNLVLNKPIVGMAATPSGRGYWMAASDGAVFIFGDAPYLGASPPHPSPVVGIAATADGGGYRLVRASGGVAHFGNAANRGSMAGRGLAFPVSGIATS